MIQLIASALVPFYLIAQVFIFQRSLWLLSLAWLQAIFVYFYWPWDILSIYLRYFFLAVMVLGIAGLVWRHFEIWRGKMGALLLGLVALMSVGLIWVFEHQPRGRKTLELVWPLVGERYFVAQGGASGWNNQHHNAPAQVFALDIVRLNGGGRHAEAVLPNALEDYEIYRDEVIAPCAGEVLAVRSFESFSVETPESAAGNFVVLKCGAAMIVLAHLDAPAALDVGDWVEVGDGIGLVGSTGNSTEPHLHIHAVLGEEYKAREVLFVGEGVPIVFEGRFLVRGDVWGW